MRTLPLILSLALSSILSQMASAQGEDLEAALKAWEGSSARLKGRVVVGSRLRQFIGMERTTEGALLKGRPSMALDRSPTRIRHKRLIRPIDTNGRIEYHFDGRELRLDLSPSTSTGPSARRYSAIWNGGWWEEGSGDAAPSPAEYGEGTVRQPFGILYTGTFRDATPGQSFVGLIRLRTSTIAREGDLLKLRASAKFGTPAEAADYTFWLSPTRGMLPVRWESGSPGGPAEIRVENRVEEVQPGLWAPTKVTARMFVPDRASPLREKVVFESIQEVDRKSSHFADPSEPMSFDLDGGVPGQPPQSGRPRSLAPAILLAIALVAAWLFYLAWRRLTIRRRGPDSPKGNCALPRPR